MGSETGVEIIKVGSLGGGGGSVLRWQKNRMGTPLVEDIRHPERQPIVFKRCFIIGAVWMEKS